MVNTKSEVQNRLREEASEVVHGSGADTRSHLPEATCCQTHAYHLAMSAYDAWHQALRELTSDEQRFASWRERRYAFAYQVGVLLTEAHAPCPAASGPALYGVYLAGTGLCYVGQTQNARRRLRDLPIGESHHLAVAAPPEIWTRIVVVQWAGLLDAALPEDDLKVCGQTLEHLLHRKFHPTVNCHSRTTDGKYRERRPEDSRSKAALSAAQRANLFTSVLTTWSELESIPEGNGTTQYREYGRAVFPSALLSNIPGASM